jgi:hypothetical protein
MVGVILFIFNFKITPFLQKIAFLIVVLTGLQCTNQKWYRELPSEPRDGHSLYPGFWVKRTPSRAPMRSDFVFHENSELIFIGPDRSFRREYKSRWQVGEDISEKSIVGEGEYIQNGNWVLFITRTRLITEKKNAEKEKQTKLDSEVRLLYYLWEQGTLLIPMIYDKAYEEKNFGVIDGVSKPYDEESSGFIRYLRFYTYEEFQPHAYHFQGEEL